MERCYIAIFRALPIINSKVELAGGHKMEIHALGAGHAAYAMASCYLYLDPLTWRLDWLCLHGGKLDSNPDSDHLSHVDCDPCRFESGFGTWCSCKCA